MEVCCSTNSALREGCRVARMPYVGVVKEVETDAMFAQVKQFVEFNLNLGIAGFMCMPLYNVAQALLDFVFGFCFCVLLFGFCFPLVCFFCFVHEVWEYSLDYVQVRNCPLL